MTKMRFTGVGQNIYLVAAVSFLVARAFDVTAPEFFAMCGASFACVAVGYVLLFAPVLGLFALWIVRRAYKRHELVTDGIYSICRHPVYALAMVGICGAVMLLRSWIMLAVPLATYLAARIFIRGEERLLVERFGQVYLDYRQRVPMFFPTVCYLFRRTRDRHKTIEESSNHE